MSASVPSLAVAAALAFAALPALAQDAGNPMSFEVDAAPLVFETAKGPVSFAVEIADTSEERAAGLMFRTDFPAERAMLFVFGNPRTVTMWMKNTPLPLDMVFVDAQGTVASIAESTTPFSTDIVSSDVPVAYTIELNAGTVDRVGIEIGNPVKHPAIAR